MKTKIILVILGSILFLCGFFICYKVSTGLSYDEYVRLGEYRRLHPELLPSKESILLTTAGNSHTYADILWIELIQYMGDNIGNGKYIDYMNPLVGLISDLHPYFTRPYTMLLLMTPAPNEEKPMYTKDLSLAQTAYKIGEKGMSINCDQKKLSEITNQEIGNTLWKNQNLQNPCFDGMIPYYMASVANNIGDKKASENYYKIASMQSDAPTSSRFLSVLERAESGDYLSAASRFLLIALGGYDENEVCHTETNSILERFGKVLPKSPTDIKWLEETEKNLPLYKDTKNLLSVSADNCVEGAQRGIKQLYLGYISELGKKFPEAENGVDLIKLSGISHIPTLSSQKNFTVKKNNDNTWSYKMILP